MRRAPGGVPSLWFVDGTDYGEYYSLCLCLQHRSLAAVGYTCVAHTGTGQGAPSLWSHTSLSLSLTVSRSRDPHMARRLLMLLLGAAPHSTAA